MTVLISWGRQLKVGHATIDRQHQELIRIANHLYSAMNERRGREVLAQLSIDLLNYTNWHFASEERLMQEHQYPRAAHHIEEHEELKDAVRDIAARAKNPSLDVTLAAMNLLRDWLSRHIQQTDRDLGVFLKTPQ